MREESVMQRGSEYSINGDAIDFVSFFKPAPISQQNLEFSSALAVNFDLLNSVPELKGKLSALIQSSRNDFQHIKETDAVFRMGSQDSRDIIEEEMKKYP